MAEITITFPDGKNAKYPKGSTALQVAEGISRGLARAAMYFVVDGEPVSATYKVNQNVSFQVVTFRDDAGKNALRHSAAHLLAAAVMEMWPDTKRTIGPAIEDGFYYDFEFSKPVTAEDLPKIEKKMQELLPFWEGFERQEVTVGKAKKEYMKNEYKVELIDEFAKDGQTITFYKSGEYVDLCRGGHVVEPKKQLKHIKLLSVAGAYWRGDENNTMLTRIYGTVFPSKKELQEHVQMLEEARKRDHRKLGRELGLFEFHEWSPGAAFYLPKGAFVFNALVNFMREQNKRLGYDEVVTPLVYDKQLFETSGHWSHFRENMILTKMDHRQAGLKPMNCPSHMLMYKMRTRSYRDLPFGFADFAMLHRNELRGTLGGLTRCRKFAQDDLHVFLREDQITAEIEKLIEFVDVVYAKVFDFEYDIVLSTKPEKAMGDTKLWEVAEAALADALKKKGLSYTVDPGEGAFYGPKIDFHIRDALKRKWQLGTLQLDFQMPKRFELAYEGADGKKHMPVVIHRAVLGSVERFFAILIEHYGGRFPLWLAPVQVKVVTVAERFAAFAEKVCADLGKDGVRVELDARSESIGYKVREAQMERVPYIVVVGEKEEQSKKFTLKTKEGIEGPVSLKELVKKCNQ